jgi:hypothetical protein
LALIGGAFSTPLTISSTVATAASATLIQSSCTATCVFQLSRLPCVRPATHGVSPQIQPEQGRWSEKRGTACPSPYGELRTFISRRALTFSVSEYLTSQTCANCHVRLASCQNKSTDSSKSTRFKSCAVCFVILDGTCEDIDRVWDREVVGCVCTSTATITAYVALPTITAHMTNV